jgi:hypothetical protein
MYPQETIANSPLGDNIILVLASLMFGGGIFAYFGYRATLRFKLKRGRALLFGALTGAVVAILLLRWLGNAGMLAAGSAMVGWFYGAWYAGQCHQIRVPAPSRRKSKSRRVSTSSRSSSRRSSHSSRHRSYSYSRSEEPTTGAQP